MSAAEKNLAEALREIADKCAAPPNFSDATIQEIALNALAAYESSQAAVGAGELPTTDDALRATLSPADQDHYKYQSHIRQRIAYEAWRKSKGSAVELNGDGTYGGDIHSQHDWHVWFHAWKAALAASARPLGDYHEGWEEGFKAASAQPDSEQQVAGEAVAWQYRWLNPDNAKAHEDELRWKAVDPRGMSDIEDRIRELRAYRYNGKPVYEVRGLYTHPTPPTSAAVPEGMVLVPVEPTQEMLAAGSAAQNRAVYKVPQPSGDQWAAVYWAAMLAAAPTQPASEGQR